MLYNIRKILLLITIPILSFGFTVGDRVWNDINQDWVQNSGENGIANVTVELYNGIGQKIATTQTDNQGKYRFSNVAMGEYIVKVIPPQGTALVTLNNLSLWVESNRFDMDFGLHTPTFYSIGDQIWNDTNKDWVQNNGEKGLANITVELYNANNQKLLTTQTDSNGKYLFNNLVEGEYIVKVVPPQGTTMVTLNNTSLYLESHRRDIDFGLFQTTPPPNNRGITINEVLAANASSNFDADKKEFSDWIELYNNENHAIDIGGYYLSNDVNNLEKWYVPLNTIIPAHSYLLVWADKEDEKLQELHTNFKLSEKKGDTVLLSNQDGILIDSITFPKQEGDISCAKIGNSIVYMNPTPNAQNSQSYATPTRSTKPSFSLKSGFYNGLQSITLSQVNGAAIYYTTDGSIPTTNSTRYTQAINISKTMVLRARALENGKFISAVANSTYFIDENISLPVFSIGIDDKYLNDNTIGIYKNYTFKWMRAGSIEYFKNGQSQFSKNVGIRLSGNYTKRYAQKSLAIFAKRRFGSKSIKYPLFRYKPTIKKVKSFVLRNSGNDWGHTMMKDGLVHTIVKDNMDIDYQSYEPAILFINGQYWGIQNIREKKNEDYIEANHGVDAKKIDYIEGQNTVHAGSYSDYQALINYIQTHNLQNSIAYNYVKSKMEIDEYINYMITELYVGNLDWPYSNIRFWKEQKATAKWRWVLYDTDISFFNDEEDSFARILDANSNAESNPPWSTFLFRNLMKNSEFKNQFITTFTSHLNLTFVPSRIDAMITQLKNAIQPEIQRHFDKWGRRSPGDWETGISDSIRELREFATYRSTNVRTLLSSHFNVNGAKNLNIITSNKGVISVDGIPLKANYSGTYFNGAKVRLKAKANAGYHFVKWSNGNLNSTIELTLNSNTNIYAIFQP